MAQGGPLPRHRPPLTTRHSPLPIHQSPLATRRSPLLTSESSPVSRHPSRVTHNSSPSPPRSGGGLPPDFAAAGGAGPRAERKRAEQKRTEKDIARPARLPRHGNGVRPGRSCRGGGRCRATASASAATVSSHCQMALFRPYERPPQSIWRPVIPCATWPCALASASVSAFAFRSCTCRCIYTCECECDCTQCNAMHSARRCVVNRSGGQPESRQRSAKFGPAEPHDVSYRMRASAARDGGL